MRWQTNMFQMKEQDKIPEEKLSEVDTANLTKKEFGVVIIQIIKELGRRMDAQSWEGRSFNKELVNIKNNQNQVKNTITEIKWDEQIRVSQIRIAFLVKFNTLH